MSVVFDYLNNLSALFNHFATGLAVLSIICVLLVLFTPSRRYFLGCTTLGVLADALLASTASYAMAPSPLNIKKTSLTTDEMWTHYILLNSYVFIFTIFYIFIRTQIYTAMAERNFWNDSSKIMRVFYGVQYLFPCTIAPMIFINSGTLAIWGLFHSLSKIITWSLGYLEQSSTTVEQPFINTTNITQNVQWIRN